MGDLGCVAKGHLAGLRVFQHSVYDLGSYCMLDLSYRSTPNSHEIHLEGTGSL